MVGQIIVSPPPQQLVVSRSVVNVSCFGLNDGSLSVNASGGTPYQYSIDGGITFQANNTFNSLSTGTYNIQVNDNQLGIATTSITISEPILLSNSNPSATPVLCCGSNDGLINLNSPSGGTSPYQYSIDGVWRINLVTYLMGCQLDYIIFQ